MKRAGLKLKDVLNTLHNHPYITVSADTPLSEVAELVRHSPDVRSIFVTDNNGKISGALSIGRLIRTITARRSGADFSTRLLLRCITCSRAGEIMTSPLISAGPDDYIDEVIDRMLEGHIKEIPVLDREGNITVNAGLLDLWSKYDNSSGAD